MNTQDTAKIVLTLAVAVLVAVGCSASGPTTAMAPALRDPMADASLGLAKGSVFDVPTPPEMKQNKSNPGEGPVLPRPYAIAPPRVPHAVDDFLPITPKQNACVDCHAVREKTPGGPTPMPASHYTDFRNAPDRAGSQIVGARYVCLSCHADKTDAPSLVENRFRP